MKEKKITYLPQIKSRLQKYHDFSDDLLAQENYQSALEKIEVLLAHNFKVIENYEKKLICLLALQEFAEAEELAEQLSKQYSYEKFQFYYIKSLYEQAFYELIVDFYEKELQEKLRDEKVLQAILPLYQDSRRQVDQKAKSIEKQLELAVLTVNHPDQWHLFHQWKQLQIEPPPIFIDLLSREEMNSFVKTYMIEALQKWEVNKEVEIVKGGQVLKTKIMEISPISQNLAYRRTLQNLSEIEQKNPTLYELVLQLIHRYVEYIYPFLYDEQDASTVSQAATAIAKHHLGEAVKIGEGFDLNQFQSYQSIIEKSNEAYFKLILA